MSTRLDKAQSRERMRQLRELWNGWDPIGVMGSPDSPLDEYSGYAGQSMRFLEKGATDELVKYLHWVVIDHMGLTQEPNPGFAEFAGTLQKWFNQNWLGTYV